MIFRYDLNDKPPLGHLLLFSLQWLALSIPTIIIIGKVIAVIHFTDPGDQIVYLQKLSFVIGLSLVCQVLWGHRLPLIVGPAAVLLVGVISSQGAGISTIYTSVLVGGLVLFFLGSTGLFGSLVKLFTPRVVAVILLLIALTLSPTIMNLIINPQGISLMGNLCFSIVFVLCIFWANRYLTGIWKSTLIIWSMLIGSFAYFLVFKTHTVVVGNYDLKILSGFFTNLNFSWSIDPGVLISFLLCFLALSVNDVGSIQSVGELIKPGQMEKRLSRGICISGLSNMLSGLFGVIGVVNFSLSPGVIMSTGCASRFTLLPAGLGIMVLAFFPVVLAFLGSIPPVVIGVILLYVMCSQIAAGLMLAFNSDGGFNFDDGLIIGLPLMLGIIISFLPSNVLSTFPLSLRPILGNGFVVGVLVVLILEHVIYKDLLDNKSPTGTNKKLGSP